MTEKLLVNSETIIWGEGRQQGVDEVCEKKMEAGIGLVGA